MEYISHEEFKNFMGKFQRETPKGMLKEALDPVGKEDEDPDNDGTPNTDSDKYILKRRKAVGKAIKGGLKEGEGAPKVLEYVNGTKYRIQNPDGEEVVVNFNDYEIEEELDVYSSTGRIFGQDDKHFYSMDADFTNMGGGDYEIDPAYESLEAEPLEKEDIPGFGGTWDGLDSLTIKREGLHMPPLQATGPTIDTVEEDITKLLKRRDTSKLDYDPDATRFEPDYMKTPGEDDDDDDDDNLEFDDEFDITSSEELPKHFRKAIATDKSRFPFLKENTGNAPFGFDVLSPDERNQLREFIESVKTIKKEIAKLTAKAGKKVKAGDLGGNRTGLVMTPSVTSEADSHEKIEKVEEKIPEKVYQASVLVIRQLRKAGLTNGEIMMFLKHEMEEEAQNAIMSQHD